MLDKLMPWSFSPERARWGRREGGKEEGLARRGPGTLGKVGERAAGVCDRRGLGWGPCDQTAVTVFPFLLFVSFCSCVLFFPSWSLG